ncbi:6-hydroxy-D-nicotine oxidase [Cytospora mali]|uniref:6-hydroxy-D-nicotine oxidase n=1 Tax=Cytospora mali TaxID=578113 RepID=A0A194UXP3_CYTMA|nr:6-hydroxy-D-nicotine oxidase [Valsa mali var. pyri (nom. inval.)]
MVDIKTIFTDSSNGWSADTKIRFPDDEEFAKVTTRWAAYKPPTYAAAISPATEEDVVKAVKLATKHGIHFLATAGRHGYSTVHGKLQNCLAIDLRQLNSIKLDMRAETVTVGGGVTTGEVLDPLFEAGFGLPTGSCSATGIVGSTLGGSVGRYSGVYGLLIDSLLSLRVMTASATSEPELFWGMRGAGANLGVVASATYRIYRIADDPRSRGNVTNIDFVIPAPMAPAYFEMLRNTLAAADEAREVIAPLLALKPPVIVVQNIPTNKLLHAAAFGFIPLIQQNSAIRSAYSANMKNISGPVLQDVFDKMCALYEAHPDARGSAIEMEHFPNQAMAAVPDEETAYPWRDSRNSIICLFSWQDPNSSAPKAVAELGPQLRANLCKAGGYHDVSVYVSYSQGDETLEQIYGRRKLPRLAALNKASDPNNVFDYNFTLPTEYP